MHSRVLSYLMAGWQRHNLLTLLLLPISLLFGGLAFLRRLLFSSFLRPRPLPVPVIVVGNIYVGGTGKTPFTIWLVAQLRAAGFTPGVISRGYGSSGNVAAQAARLVTSLSLAQEVGDEPLLIVQKTACPLMVGKQRYAVAKALLEQFPEVDVLISDDGLQHYALPRDIEIMLFDQRGCGNRSLLPAGPLREGPRRRRDFTIINGGLSGDVRQFGAAQAAQTYAMQLCGTHAWQLCRLHAGEHMLELSQLTQAHAGKILAAAGIGHPERFFSMLAAQHIQCATLALPDHFDFAYNPFQDSYASSASLILITEKDAVKCAASASLANDPRIWVVPVEAQIDTALAQQLVEKCRGRSFA